MAGPIVARKLIQMGLDFTGNQIKKNALKKTAKMKAKPKPKPKPKSDIRSRAFYDSIYKHL